MHPSIPKLIFIRLLKHAAPDRVPRTGERAQKVNCYVIYLRNRDEGWSVLVDKVKDEGVEGRYWSGSNHDTHAAVPWNAIQAKDIEINHFFKTYDFYYDGLWSYIFKGATGYDRLRTYIDRGAQFLYNKRPLMRSDRIEILKLLVDKAVTSPNSAHTAVSLMGDLHTKRWVFHPSHIAQLEYNKLLLESLKSSEDIKKTDHGYVVTGKALLTISQYETESLRHRDTVQQAKHMKWLTFALIGVGLLQAWVTWKS